MNDREIALWVDERWYQALSQQLENETVEEKLDNYLDELISQLPDHVQEKIRSAGMYVLSSDYEGISNSMLEAMALGMPVIATDCPIGGSKMYIKDGINGLLVPVGDAQALAAAMDRLAGDAAFARQLGAEAAKVKENLAVSRIADRFLTLSEKSEKDRY